MTVLDYMELSALFAKELPQALFITPSLLREYLLNIPGVLKSIEAIFIGGERLSLDDIIMSQSLIKGTVFSVYGPTENTGFSTSYAVDIRQPCTNGVPIGRPLTNSGAHVLDRSNKRVPVGVIGELVVTGDGLARGYTDSRLDAGRFVTISLGQGQQNIRAYRTGDHVRCRPQDGQLEFYGRIDGQVKIRGQRVELAEIEHALKRDHQVADAVALLYRDAKNAPQLAAFASIRDTVVDADALNLEDRENSKEAQHEDVWEEVFDADTYVAINDIKPGLIGRDFVGWTSMYDGSEIDKGEMSEWLDDTMNDILCSTEEGLTNVLEIGSGSGMILFNLPSDSLISYTGLDPSAQAINFVNKAVKQMPEFEGKVHMFKGTAMDIGPLDQLGSPDTVIFNSVLQYFPSQEYLAKVIEYLLRITSVRTIYIGDIRSYALYHQFLASRALFMAGDETKPNEVRRMMEDMERAEREFLVDPAFFTKLVFRFPDLVGHVEILPKKMRANNELSRYRYAAVIHTKSKLAGAPVHEIKTTEWLDYVKDGLTSDGLKELLRRQNDRGSPMIAVSNIPYDKTIEERYIMEELNKAKHNSQLERNWVYQAREKAKGSQSLSAMKLRDLAHGAGYGLELSCARQFSQHGGLDAVFYHVSAADDKGEENQRRLFQFPTDHEGRPQHLFSNRPLRQQMAQSIRERLDKSLVRELPSYMIPQSIVVLESLPVNANGKTDRKALAEMVQTRVMERQSIRQAVTPAERAMQGIWAHALDLASDKIGLDDSFFKLGGDSLAAMRVVGEARKQGFQLQVADVFRSPQLGDLAAHMVPSDDRAMSSIPTRAGKGAEERQSYAQERLWFLDQLHPGLDWYLMPFATRLHGRLNTKALEVALLAIEQRQETLRTTFYSADGINFQVVQPFIEKKLTIIDLSHSQPKQTSIDGFLERDRSTPINLKQEAGWRVNLYKLSQDEHVLSIVMHHIVSDGWSIDVLRRQLAELYSEAVRGEDILSTTRHLPIQYRDFSVWQRDQEQASGHKEQLDYWLEQLRDSRPAEFPCDLIRPPSLSGKADVQSMRIEGPVYTKLQHFCKQRGLTPFVVLLAAFRVAHLRLTGATDATIGMPNANRDRWELKDMIGFFVNVQCLRLQAEPTDSFDSLIERVQETTTASFANQDVPFERIVSNLQKDRDVSRNPLVQVMFAFHAQKDLGNFTLEGVETEAIARGITSRFDMEMHFFQEKDAFQGQLIFSTDLFIPENISAILSVLSKVIEEALDDTTLPIDILPLMTDEGYSGLVNMGLIEIKKTTYPADSTIVDVFCQQVSETPTRVAVKDALAQMTYSDLDLRSDMIARWISARTYPPETLVGVFVKRSCEAIAIFLGILKAGLAYLPFDIKTPVRRIQTILSSIPGHHLILVGGGLELPRLEMTDVELMYIPGDFDHLPSQNTYPMVEPTAVSSSNKLAYVMFTSGSTGKPKGVKATHRGVIRLCKNNSPLFDHMPHSGIMAHASNLAFDASTWEIYATILNGGTLICIDTEILLDPIALRPVFDDERIQMLFITPALLKQYLEESPELISSLETLLIGGERLNPHTALAAQNLVQGNFLHVYGPTENTGFSTCYHFRGRSHDRCANGVAIGRAIDNSGAYVMDAKQRLVPLGVIGELVVTGDGLAQGYTDKARNRDRFVNVVVGGEEIAAYRTGDYVRYRPTDGQLEFYGRMDGQVKIRGQRVELSEIEQHVSSHGRVENSVAILHGNEGQEPTLTCFVTLSTEASGEMPSRAVGDGHEEEKIEQVWEDMFDADTYTDIASAKPEAVGRDFIGWTSMYDGSNIPVEEMDEWLQDTMMSLLASGPATDVLEIGTGSGMILFNLVAKSLHGYIGLEPSERAVGFVMRTCQIMPDLNGKVKVYKATAAELPRLNLTPTSLPPTLAVINSVAQYFPSQDYLLNTIKELLAMGVKQIFLGDIRSFALYEQFLASRALFMFKNIPRRRVGKEELRRMINDMKQIERELLVDPFFFTSLPSRLPQLIGHVEVFPKRMRATNELSRYRYTVVIHGSLGGQGQPSIHGVPSNAWQDFREMGVGRDELAELVKSSVVHSTVCIRNIPDSKTIFETRLVDALRSNSDDDMNWLTAVQREAANLLSLSAVDLEDIARQAGCEVEINCGLQRSQKGGLDAIFHQIPPSGGLKRTLFQFPTDSSDTPLRTLSSQPLRQQELNQVRDELFHKLQTELPSYMVPKAICFLDSLPVNDNGKIDRRQLEKEAVQVTTKATDRGSTQQPTTECERQMQSIWAQILNIDSVDIGVQDSFFHLGGDSLAAMKVVGLARKSGMQISVADIFRQPCLQDICASVEDGKPSSRDQTITSLAKSNVTQQSFAQERLWFMEQLHPGLTWYLMPCAMRVRGPIQVEALNMAIAALISRHETLRTIFSTKDDLNLQRVQDDVDNNVKLVEVPGGTEGSLRMALQREQTKPFDLEKEPGWRVTLLKLNAQDHVLSIMMHHIISDGWSVEVLRNEMAILYSAALQGRDLSMELDPLPVQYRDYAVWQREQDQLEESERQLEYWSRQIEFSRPAEFICDKPRPSRLSGEADVQQILIADSLYEKLEKYCQVHGVTKYVVLLAIFRLTHFRMTGSDDAVIGAPNANRDRWEIKDMIGFFVNLQCIRIKVQQESFDSLIQHVKEVTTASFANQDVPFERLVAKLQQPRSLSRNPLAQITFALHSQVDISRFDLEGLETEPVGIEITSRFDMEFHFFQEQDRLRGQLIYSTDLFESESVAQIIAIFCRTLESVLEDSAMPVHVLPLIDREQLALMEKMALVEVTQTTYPWELSVVDVFRQQVTQNPEAVAVAELDSANNLTYRQLDGKSNQVAAWLHSHQLPSETLIGVFADRSALSIIAVLGILKANMAYIPFDIRVPEGRMMTMLSSISSRKLILTGDVEPPCVHLTGVDCFKIRDVLEDQLATQCESQLIRKLEGPTPDSLAYVMFTSGSTGQPKGVMIEHRGIVRLAKDSRMLESLPPSPTVAHLGNMAFDASTWEIFTALLNGGTLVCIDTEALLEHKLRHELFTSYAIQAALFTPALLKQCLLDSPTLFAGLETLVIGGDRVDPRDLHKVRQHMKTGTILNAYGPTENTVASTIYRIPVDENNVNGVPIGRALSNSGAYVMDDEQRLVPLGVAGELVVTGDGLARGYTDPTLNQNRFLDVTVAGKTQRGYRTGDYVRYRPRDGQLEYMGRIDGQIKIRGQRVELGEIEHILKKHESVDQGVTLLSQSNESSSHLAAFITLSKESQDGLHAHGNAESGHENAWQDLFDNETYTVIEDIDKTKIGRDFTGWTSMYDGEKIDEAEMDEWLDDVVNTILENGGLGNVLEIGSGSGMIAFNIADHVQSYTGIEPSKSAADFILKASESMPALKDRVRMIQGTAADVGMIRQLGYILPDTVILNSVLQYFPSQDYLFNMVENLAQLGSAQTIFIGDIRSYALYRQFLASRVLHMTQGTKPSREDVKRMMEDMSRAEKEFLVDPAFFTGLKARLKQVEHVEIIPKKMQATNELSSYRYAARIHLRAGEGQSMKIHAAPGQWVHFVEQGLTQDSLHDALRQIPAASPGLAVANIPHRKTLLERHMLESLDETSNEEDNDWFSTVQHKVERQASLSAVDIGDMAKEVGLCASMSWARQSSQNGGIDVIFYRPHDTESQKPLFEFPTDDGAVPTDALANRPMWQQISSTVRGEVMEVLKSQLPSYMVPQTITVLDNIPINQNGKVDRQALGKLAIAPTVKGVVRQPRSNTEEQIRAIWAHALGVKENDIGLDDNFFRLGGDSMTAMRVAGEARKRCLDIVVADIFRFDNLEQLANRPGITKEAIIQESDDMTLIESSKMDRLLVDLQGPGIPYLPDDVVQILPSTSVQEGYVFDDFQFQHFTNYFYLDLGETLDVERFKNSCMSLVDMFLILRTCFLRLQGSIWQVVLRDAALHIDVTNVHAESLDQSSNTICQDDWHKINPRQLPTAFMLIKHETEGFRLLMRLQHAQYDGVSLPIILQSLLNLYHGIQPRVGPSFSRFLAYAANRRDESLAYWKQLLAGSSSSTRLEGKLGRVSSPESPLIHVGAETEVPLPDLGGKITSATVASAAWAVLLSVVAGATDVIYGHRVAGRNSTMDGIEDVVAPCLNVIPVRVQLSPSRQTVAELLHAVQEQFLAVGEADSVGYKDVMRHATDWHTAEAEEDDLEFGTVIQHQNVDENPEISMGDATTAATTRVGYFSNPLFMWRSIVMVSYPRQGDRGGNDRTLLLRVGANSHIMSAASAQKIVDALGDVVGRLCGGFANGQSLEECMAGLEVDLTG